LARELELWKRRDERRSGLRSNPDLCKRRGRQLRLEAEEEEEDMSAFVDSST
jgi:hypothetical protein